MPDTLRRWRLAESTLESPRCAESQRLRDHEKSASLQRASPETMSRLLPDPFQRADDIRRGWKWPAVAFFVQFDVEGFRVCIAKNQFRLGLEKVEKANSIHRDRPAFYQKY